MTEFVFGLCGFRLLEIGVDLRGRSSMQHLTAKLLQAFTASYHCSEHYIIQPPSEYP